MSLNRYALGIDGCRAGWFCVFNDGISWSFCTLENINLIKDRFSFAQLASILIDIPIGLPFLQKRKCDQLARKILGRGRSSSIFPVPSRKALYADNYNDACNINQRILGVKLSRQTWNIRKGIIEVDNFLQINREYQSFLLEAHPEVAFWALAHGRPMKYYKKSAEGFEERMDVLQQYVPEVESLFEKAMKAYPRKALSSDDILDAFALALSAEYPESLKSLPALPELDELGIPMQIVYSTKYLENVD